MSTVKKRKWVTNGVTKEAWRVRYVDQHGHDRTRQFDKKSDAEAYRIKAEGQVAAGIHTPDSRSVTVNAAADIHLASCRANGCDRGTLKSYKEIADRHIRPFIGTEKLSRLTGPKVVEYRDALLATRSHAMASKAVRHLSMILIEAMNRGLVSQNVARDVKVKRPRQDGKRQRLAKRADIPPIEHQRAMLEAADRLGHDDPRLPVMVPLVMLAGLRASELRALPWETTDLKHCQITVGQRADRWNDIGAPKSSAGHRTIPVGPSLITRLKAWKLRCPRSTLGLVFPATRKDRRWAAEGSEMGLGPIKQGTMADLLLKVQVEAGIAINTGKQDAKGRPVWKLRWDWHHLRHVAASNWLNDGIDLKRLQVWIGHENIQLTIDVYGHLIKDPLKDAELAGKAEAALFG